MRNKHLERIINRLPKEDQEYCGDLEQQQIAEERQELADMRRREEQEEQAMREMTVAAKEQVLDDCTLIFEDFYYLVDGIPQRSPITGTAQGLKRLLCAGEIRRCDVVGRGLHKK